MTINIQNPLSTGYDAHTTAEEIIKGEDLTGKTVIITGGYSGIGLEMTRVLTKAGARVIVPVRTPEKAKKNLDGLQNVEVAQLDLMNWESIDLFADSFLDSGRTLDTLILCAGIMYTPLRRDIRGYESQFSTDHLGHFRLTARLWPSLVKAKSARVVVLSSLAHRLCGIDFDDPNFEHKEYDKYVAYAQTKTANSLFAVQLDRIGKEYGVRAYAVHPGSIPATDLTRDLKPEERVARPLTDNDGNPLSDESRIQFKTIPEGAATAVWCAVAPELQNIGGVYCEDCDIARLVADDYPGRDGVRRWAVDPEAALRLWSMSEEMIGITFDGKAGRL